MGEDQDQALRSATGHAAPVGIAVDGVDLRQTGLQPRELIPTDAAGRPPAAWEVSSTMNSIPSSPSQA